MGAQDHESFVRWQSITRDYFSSVSNLVLGLATGLLAFVVSDLASLQTASGCFLFVVAASVVLLSASIALAVWCTINRLRDFRATTKIARSRWKDEPVNPADRHDSKIVGQLSWRLFWWQLVLFGSGAVGAALAVVSHLLA